MDNPLWDAASAIGNALNYAIETPGSLTRGLFAGKPGTRMSTEDFGREVLGVENMSPLGAFALNVATDPLTYIGAPSISGLSKAFKGVKTLPTLAHAYAWGAPMVGGALLAANAREQNPLLNAAGLGLVGTGMALPLVPLARAGISRMMPTAKALAADESGAIPIGKAIAAQVDDSVSSAAKSLSDQDDWHIPLSDTHDIRKSGRHIILGNHKTGNATTASFSEARDGLPGRVVMAYPSFELSDDHVTDMETLLRLLGHQGVDSAYLGGPGVKTTPTLVDALRKKGFGITESQNPEAIGITHRIDIRTPLESDAPVGITSSPSGAHVAMSAGLPTVGALMTYTAPAGEEGDKQRKLGQMLMLGGTVAGMALPLGMALTKANAAKQATKANRLNLAAQSAGRMYGQFLNPDGSYNLAAVGTMAREGRKPLHINEAAESVLPLMQHVADELYPHSSQYAGNEDARQDLVGYALKAMQDAARKAGVTTAVDPAPELAKLLGIPNELGLRAGLAGMDADTGPRVTAALQKIVKAMETGQPTGVSPEAEWAAAALMLGKSKATRMPFGHEMPDILDKKKLESLPPQERAAAILRNEEEERKSLQLFDADVYARKNVWERSKAGGTGGEGKELTRASGGEGSEINSSGMEDALGLPPGFDDRDMPDVLFPVSEADAYNQSSMFRPGRDPTPITNEEARKLLPEILQVKEGAAREKQLRAGLEVLTPEEGSESPRATAKQVSERLIAQEEAKAKAEGREPNLRGLSDDAILHHLANLKQNLLAGDLQRKILHPWESVVSSNPDAIHWLNPDTRWDIDAVPEKVRRRQELDAVRDVRSAYYRNRGIYDPSDLSMMDRTIHEANIDTQIRRLQRMGVMDTVARKIAAEPLRTIEELKSAITSEQMATIKAAMTIVKGREPSEVELIAAMGNFDRQQRAKLLLADALQEEPKNGDMLKILRLVTDHRSRNAAVAAQEARRAAAAAAAPETIGAFGASDPVVESVVPRATRLARGEGQSIDDWVDAAMTSLEDQSSRRAAAWAASEGPMNELLRQVTPGAKGFVARVNPDYDTLLSALTQADWRTQAIPMVKADVAEAYRKMYDRGMSAEYRDFLKDLAKSHQEYLQQQKSGPARKAMTGLDRLTAQMKENTRALVSRSPESVARELASISVPVDEARYSQPTALGFDVLPIGLQPSTRVVSPIAPSTMSAPIAEAIVRAAQQVQGAPVFPQQSLGQILFGGRSGTNPFERHLAWSPSYVDPAELQRVLEEIAARSRS